MDLNFEAKKSNMIVMEKMAFGVLPSNEKPRGKLIPHHKREEF